MVRAIEAAVIEWLDSLGISAYGKPSAPGVYAVASRRRGEDRRARIAGEATAAPITGSRVNIAMDLAPFADIDPCGYRGLAVTQLADLGVAQTVDGAGAELAPMLAARLPRRKPTHGRSRARRCERRRRQAQGRAPRRARIPDQDRRRPSGCRSPTGSACARRRRRASTRSSRSCASTTCTRCARKPRARTSANASARARRRS